MFRLRDEKEERMEEAEIHGNIDVSRLARFRIYRSDRTLLCSRVRGYDTIDEEGEIFKGFTTTRLYMPVPGGHWLYPALHRLHSYLRSPPASPSSLLIPSI